MKKLQMIWWYFKTIVIRGLKTRDNISRSIKFRVIKFVEDVDVMRWLQMFVKEKNLPRKKYLCVRKIYSIK